MHRGTAFTDPSVAGHFFRDKLAGLEREVFAVIFLDCRHRLIDYAELFFGTIDGAEVHPRELVKQALLLNAAAVLVAHNHPSRAPEPSAADRALTVRPKQALSLVDRKSVVQGKRVSVRVGLGGRRILQKKNQ